MRLIVLLGLAIITIGVPVNSSVAADFKCYSAPDTCQVCWDTTVTPWIMQVLDLHACDTVRIGCPVCVNDLAVGDSFRVPIYLYNDAKLAAFSFSFRHYGNGLRFGYGGENGLDTDGATVLTFIQQASVLFLADSAAAIVAWIDFSETRPIAVNTTGAAKLLGYLYLVLTADIHQVVQFDTAFYPLPGGWPNGGGWLALNTRIDSNYPLEYPKFAMCKDVASPPCDVNFGDTPLDDCGDVDGSGGISIADVVYIISYIFANGATPQNTRGGDIDCDLRVTIADVISLINYIFRAGPIPCLGCP